MTDDEFLRLLKAVLDRGNKEWDRPSGAMLQLIKELAAEGKLKEVAEACGAYFRVYPGSARSVTNDAPGVIFNNYPAFKPYFNTVSILEWDDILPDWKSSVAESLASVRLPIIVDALVARVERYIQERRTPSRP